MKHRLIDIHDASSAVHVGRDEEVSFRTRAILVAAVWKWRSGFENHWGDHAIDALRALRRTCRRTRPRGERTAARAARQWARLQRPGGRRLGRGGPRAGPH